MIATVANHLLALPAAVVLALVFAMPMLESSAFLGFVFPGEITLIIGGILAYQGTVPLAAVLVLGSVGAVLGDSIGYGVGRRWGRTMLDGSLGRFVQHHHFDRAETYLAARGGKAVFLGRFTAALRVMIPGLAGMARMPYRRFLVFNVAGGVGWVVMSVLLGYAGGSSWEHAAQLSSRIGFVVLGLVVVLAVGGVLLRRHRQEEMFEAAEAEAHRGGSRVSEQRTAPRSDAAATVEHAPGSAPPLT